MKIKIVKLALGFSLMILPFGSFAEELRITVKGMVCSFCAQGIRKTFGKLAAISKVDVDLDNKLVNLGLKEGAILSDKDIEQRIHDAGYEVLKIERIPHA